MKFFTVTTQSKIDYDFSATTIKHGAFTSFDAALKRLKDVVEDFKMAHRKDFEKYSNKEYYENETEGALVVYEDFERGYWGCEYGLQEHHEGHQICIDVWEVEEA